MFAVITRQNVSRLAAIRRGYITLSEDFRGKGSSPCQYIDITRKAIDCATTLPLTIFIYVDFCIGWAEYPPYFQFRSSWPTDLESVSCDAYLTVKVYTKFEADTTIRCLVIALLLLIRYVTLLPWPLTFWPWSVVIHGGSRGQSLHQVWRSCGYPFLSYKFWHLP